MSFGDILRSGSVPDYRPWGIGGDANTIWHSATEYHDIVELSIYDFSIIRLEDSPSTAGLGIGGDAVTIWHCDAYRDRIYELSTIDFSIIRREYSPSSYPSGIGGDAGTIWHCDTDAELNYELSTIDFSVIRSDISPDISPRGIGGDTVTIWHLDDDADFIYELSIIDFSTIQSTNAPTDGGYGIGGDTNTIWYVRWLPGIAYELDTGVISFAPTGLLCCNKASSIGPTGLCVPAEINRLRPYFSAIYNDPVPWDTAVFYQIQVSNSTSFLGELLWDSGKIAMSPVSEGNRCENISYAGSSLSIGTIFYWRIKFWDNEGFESPYSITACFRITSAGPHNLLCEQTKNPTNVSDPQPEFSAINR